LFSRDFDLAIVQSIAMLTSTIGTPNRRPQVVTCGYGWLVICR
jgi:hypothetical protein